MPENLKEASKLVSYAEEVWAIISFGVFGAVAATARYVNDVMQNNEKFSFKRWLCSSFVGVVVAVIAGGVGKSFDVTDEMLYAVVGIAAISSKEIIVIIPKLAISYVERLHKKGKKND